MPDRQHPAAALSPPPRLLLSASPQPREPPRLSAGLAPCAAAQGPLQRSRPRPRRRAPPTSGPIPAYGPPVPAPYGCLWPFQARSRALPPPPGSGGPQPRRPCLPGYHAGRPPAAAAAAAKELARARGTQELCRIVLGWLLETHRWHQMSPMLPVPFCLQLLWMQGELPWLLRPLRHSAVQDQPHMNRTIPWIPCYQQRPHQTTKCPVAFVSLRQSQLAFETLTGRLCLLPLPIHPPSFLFAAGSVLCLSLFLSAPFLLVVSVQRKAAPLACPGQFGDSSGH